MNEQHWVSVWGNAVSVAENRPERYAKDITIRYPVLIPFNGTGLRLTFDNYCGTEAVTLNKTTVFYGGVFYPVHFNGKREVTIPAEFDKVFAGYNELQKAQGLDLSKYKKKTVTRYTFTVTNYDGYDGTVYANVLVYRNRVIGGDICSADVSGFIHGFERPAEE